jgi:hypothetical protein
MNKKFQKSLVFFLIILILAISVFFLISQNTKVTGYAVSEPPACLESEVLIRAVDQENNYITSIPDDSFIYITYRNGSWPNWVTLTLEFNESNGYSVCVNQNSDNIKLRACGPAECSNYKYMQRDLGDNITSLDGKAEFIIISINLNDQNGVINSSHNFYDNAFVDVDNSGNKLVFGDMRNSDEFIVPAESEYSYTPFVESSLRSYNDIQGSTFGIESASDDLISASFRTIMAYNFNESCGVSGLGSIIYKSSNEREVYELQNNDLFCVPVGGEIKYGLEDGFLFGPETITDGIEELYITSLENLSCSLPEPCEENWICGNWTECINETQSRECTELNGCETIFEIPILIQNCTLPEPCEENWICGNWSECVDENQTRECIDEQLCGTNESKPIIIQNCTLPEPEPGSSSPSGGGGGVSRRDREVVVVSIPVEEKDELEEPAIEIVDQFFEEPEILEEPQQNFVSLVGNTVKEFFEGLGRSNYLISILITILFILGAFFIVRDIRQKRNKKSSSNAIENLKSDKK